jgi:hypothetical protein
MLRLNDLSIILVNNYKVEMVFNLKGAKEEKEYRGYLITKYSNPELGKIMIGLSDDKDTGIKQVCLIYPSHVKELTVTIPPELKSTFAVKILEATLSPTKIKYTIL